MAIIIKCDNGSVTDWCLECIGKVISDAGEKVKYTRNIQNVYTANMDEIVVVARLLDFIKIYCKGYRNIITWFQGVEPEESFMKHNSKIRYVVLSYFEKIALDKPVLYVAFSDVLGWGRVSWNNS